MKTLYEIDNAYLKALEMAFTVDEETGEVLLADGVLDALQGEFEAKADAIACVIKEKRALIEARKKEMESLKAKNDSESKQIDRLIDYLTRSLDLREQDKLTTARNTISFRKSKSVNVIDEKLIPLEFINIKETRSVNKTEIMKHLKNGETISGCEIKESRNMQLK